MPRPRAADYRYILGANALCELEKNAESNVPGQADEPVAMFACPIANGTIACDDESLRDVPADLRDKVLGLLAAWPAGPVFLKPLAPPPGGPPA